MKVVIIMQCPKCNMKVADGAKMCLHCGTQFTYTQVQPDTQVLPEATGEIQCPNCQAFVSGASQFCTNCGARLKTNVQQAPNQQYRDLPQGQTPVQQFSTNSGTIQANAQVLKSHAQWAQDQEDRIKYQKAYFGKDYQKVTTSNFSFSTFILGIPYLLIHKLYSVAIEWFVIGIIAATVITILSVILFFFRPIIDIGAFCFYFYFSIVFARKFYPACLERANREINAIMAMTNDEEERLRLCKKAHKPSYIWLTVTILLIISPFLLSFWNASQDMNNTRQYSFENIAESYLSEVKNGALANNLQCGDKDISSSPAGMYFYSFTTATGTTATDLMLSRYKSPWGNANVTGQVLIYKKIDDFGEIYDVAIVLVDEAGRGIGEFSANGTPEKAISRNNLKHDHVATKDGKNRKLYYTKASVGTDKALNIDTAPTTKTLWDDKELGKDMGITTNPIACKIIDN